MYISNYVDTKAALDLTQELYDFVKDDSVSSANQFVPIMIKYGVSSLLLGIIPSESNPISLNLRSCHIYTGVTTLLSAGVVSYLSPLPSSDLMAACLDGCLEGIMYSCIRAAILAL